MADDADQTIERELARLVRALEAARQPPGTEGGTAMDRAAYLLLDSLATRPRPAGELASDLHLDQSTVTRQLGALIDRNLVRRRRDPDGGRAAVVELTRDGRTQLLGERATRTRRINRTLEGWSDQDRDQLAQLLVRLNASIDRRLRTVAKGGR